MERRGCLLDLLVVKLQLVPLAAALLLEAPEIVWGGARGAPQAVHAGLRASEKPQPNRRKEDPGCEQREAPRFSACYQVQWHTSKTRRAQSPPWLAMFAAR